MSINGWNRTAWKTPRDLFGGGKILIGVVHLLPLPGAPLWDGDLARVLQRAAAEARALHQGGAHGLIVENFGDAPFRAGPVAPETVAGMTLAVKAAAEAAPLPVGVNMLRNDAQAALAVAAVAGAAFIRVNVHYGVMAADEGVIEGQAYETVRQRRYLNAPVSLLADVLVKHAAPLGPQDLLLTAQETVRRGRADGLIISGPATGRPTANSDLSVVRRGLPGEFLLAGSGVDAANAAYALQNADGAIVGTSLKRDGVITNPIDPERVRRLAEIFRNWDAPRIPGFPPAPAHP